MAMVFPFTMEGWGWRWWHSEAHFTSLQSYPIHSCSTINFFLKSHRLHSTPHHFSQFLWAIRHCALHYYTKQEEIRRFCLVFMIIRIWNEKEEEEGSLKQKERSFPVMRMRMEIAWDCIFLFYILEKTEKQKEKRRLYFDDDHRRKTSNKGQTLHSKCIIAIILNNQLWLTSTVYLNPLQKKVCSLKQW